jgi:hypothetical protein
MIRGALSRLLSFDDGCRGLCFVFMMVDKQMVPTQAGGDRGQLCNFAEEASGLIPSVGRPRYTISVAERHIRAPDRPGSGQRVRRRRFNLHLGSSDERQSKVHGDPDKH